MITTAVVGAGSSSLNSRPACSHSASKKVREILVGGEFVQSGRGDVEDLAAPGEDRLDSREGLERLLLWPRAGRRCTAGTSDKENFGGPSDALHGKTVRRRLAGEPEGIGGVGQKAAGKITLSCSQLPEATQAIRLMKEKK